MKEGMTFPGISKVDGTDDETTGIF